MPPTLLLFQRSIINAISIQLGVAIDADQSQRDRCARHHPSLARRPPVADTAPRSSVLAACGHIDAAIRALRPKGCVLHALITRFALLAFCHGAASCALTFTLHHNFLMPVTAASKAYRGGAGPGGAAGAHGLLQHLFVGVNERIQELDQLVTRDTYVAVVSPPCSTSRNSCPVLGCLIALDAAVCDAL